VTPDAEFGYELLVCRYAELAWYPGEGPRPAVVARQLGTKERRWDTVVIEVDPAAFAARRAFGDRTIDSDLHVVRHAPPSGRGTATRSRIPAIHGATFDRRSTALPAAS